MEDATFERPEGFDPEALLAGAFDLVYDDPISARIWIAADQVRYVKERKLPGKASMVEQPDGSMILELETSGRWDVRRWVLSFGRGAELLEPSDLREEIREELAETVGRYR